MKIALGVTGCIAAYKAVEVLRGLQKRGVTVQVVMTRHATEFVARSRFSQSRVCRSSQRCSRRRMTLR